MQRSHAGEPVGHLGPGGYTYTSPLTRPFSALQRQNTGGSRGYKKTPTWILVLGRGPIGFLDHLVWAFRMDRAASRASLWRFLSHSQRLPP